MTPDEAARMIAFIRARLDEDERLAINARPDYFTPRVLGVFSAAGDAAHAIRHNPDRVRREIAAKRAIVDQAAQMLAPGAITTKGADGIWVSHPIANRAMRFTLVQMAAVYRDHPDWREEWAA